MCVAVPGRVLEVSEDRGTPVASVEFRAGRRTVCLAFVPEARPGDWVVVHLGMALETVDDTTARETLALLEEAGLLDGTGDGVATPAAP